MPELKNCEHKNLWIKIDRTKRYIKKVPKVKKVSYNHLGLRRCANNHSCLSVVLTGMMISDQ